MPTKTTKVTLPKRLTNSELDKLYTQLAEGLTTLQRQSEAGSDDAQENRARLLFCALAAYLADHEILDHLLGAAVWMSEKRNAA